MSEEEQKYFKGLIGFTFDSDDIKYIEKIVDKKDKEIERLHSIIKALHKYFEEHEQYEDNEFLRQLESTIENDKEWLKKMGGEQ